MGKDIITYKKRLELIDDCLRKFAQPMNVEEIRNYCNKRLNKDFSLRMYRYDITETIPTRYNAELCVDMINGKKCYTYADEGFSIKGEAVANQVELLNFRKIKNYLAEFTGLGLDANLNTITDEIDKFLGYTENKRAVISFEKIILESRGKHRPLDLLQPFFQAIIQHQTMDITYEVPGRGIREWTVFPQFLKQYNQRWYLIATRHRNEDESKLYNLALDRILKYEANQHITYKESEIDFADYFENVVGLTIPEGTEPKKVILRVERGEYPYIESKPIHPSQDELHESDNDDKYVYISLDVYDNYELRSKILSYGSKVTVMEPQSLRDKIVHELSRSLACYSK